MTVGVLEGKKGTDKREVIIKQIITENFPDLKIDLQVKGVTEFQVITMRKDTPRHMWGKCL